MSDERFNVVQFFPDEIWERVGERLEAEAAVRMAKRLTESVGARIGTTRRVIIEDGGGHTVFEWKHGEGVTFPTPAQIDDMTRSRELPPKETP